MQYKRVKVKHILMCMLLCILCFFTGCGNNDYGEFWELTSAYQKGLLQKEDIKTIAEKHNNKHYDVMTEKDAVEMKKAYHAYNSDKHNKNTYKDVEIMEFLGEYNSCLVAILRYKDEEALTIVGTVNIADIEIFYGSSFRICVYVKTNKV